MTRRMKWVYVSIPCWSESCYWVQVKHDENKNQGKERKRRTERISPRFLSKFSSVNVDRRKTICARTIVWIFVVPPPPPPPPLFEEALLMLVVVGPFVEA